jgi:hypothetical protein
MKTWTWSRWLLASVLVAAALLSVPPRSASAETALCRQCRLYGDCLACCVCAGHTISYCAAACP